MNSKVFENSDEERTNKENVAIVPVVRFNLVDNRSADDLNVKVDKPKSQSELNVNMVNIPIYLNNNRQDQDGEKYESSSSIVDASSTANLLGNLKSTRIERENMNSNFLKPMGREDDKSSSLSSIDTRIKFGEEYDAMPLMNMNGNGHVVLINESSNSSGLKKEKWSIILLQVLFPFLIAGLGMVGAGVVLDIVQHWDLFIEIPAIFTLIPALLGLKGNLEMTLASRFSTQVNLGKIRDKSTTLSAVLGNFALTQAQAIVVGFFASVGAVILKVIVEKKFELRNAFILISGSMSTASFASLILAGLMMLVIIISKKIRINPDNVATPIAASLGDLVTLSILAYLCTLLYQLKSFIWVHVAIIAIYFTLVPVFFYYSARNEYVKDALYNGWVPIVLAMVISSSGGFIMSFAVQIYKDIAVFQPVVNGVGGNLVAIFASRLSTALHRTSTQGQHASWAPQKFYRYPLETFFGNQNPESHTAIVLASLSIPGHLFFYFTIIKIKGLQSNHINPATITVPFITFYTSVLILQVLLLLLICYWLVHLAWRLNKDPDNMCIPYLTAIGDFLGTAFLAICFHGLYLAGETQLRSR